MKVGKCKQNEIRKAHFFDSSVTKHWKMKSRSDQQPQSQFSSCLWFIFQILQNQLVCSWIKQFEWQAAGDKLISVLRDRWLQNELPWFFHLGYVYRRFPVLLWGNNGIEERRGEKLWETVHIYANQRLDGLCVLLKGKFLKQLDAVKTNRTSCFSWGPTEVRQRYGRGQGPIKSKKSSGFNLKYLKTKLSFIEF